MKSKLLPMFLSLLVLSGCNSSSENSRAEAPKKYSDLNAIKQDFINSVLKADVKDSPFDFSYLLRTVFFSKDIISLFGETDIYDHQGDNREYYEGKTYCKVNDKFIPIFLDDIFSTKEQKEFINQYATKVITDSGYKLCGTLEKDYLKSFVINENALIVILQPTLENCDGKTMIVSVPFGTIKEHWNPTNQLGRLLPQVLKSKEFTSSWDDDQFFSNDAGK